MKRIAQLLMLAAVALWLAACPERKQPEESRTVQIEEQQIRVINNLQQVQQELESTIEAGVKARERKIVE